MRLDPKVPVIEVGEEFGTIIEQSSEVSQHKSYNWVNGHCKATGADLGVRGLEMHPVCGSKVRVVLLDVVKHP